MRQGGDVLAGNYIKINRSMLEWEWYKDTNTKILFLHMLLKANWKDSSFMGTEVKRGSFVSSTKNLSLETGLSEKQVRTSILHLKKTGEVASQSTNRFTVFTVNNYGLYQDEGKPEGKQRAGKGQAEGKQRATIEEYKEGKNIKNNNKNIVRFTPPDLETVRDYCKERNNNVDPQSFIDFYSSKGWMIGKNKMKDWKAAVRTWERNRTKVTDPKPKSKNFNNFERRKYDMDSLEDQLLGR